MILTVDNGQSVTKFAATRFIDDGHLLLLADTLEQRLSGTEVQDAIIQRAKESKATNIAIATTYCILRGGKIAMDLRDDREEVFLDADKIEEATGLPTRLYNDAEAAAFALNLPNDEVWLKPGNRGEPEIKTLVYLGTGFQMVRAHRRENGHYVPSYGGAWLANLPISVLELVPQGFLETVAGQAGVSLAQLRHTHLFGSRGLGNIDAALRDERKEVGGILENPHPRTFPTYFLLLGRCLQNFVSNEGFSQELYLGGSFATAAVRPLLNDSSDCRDSFWRGYYPSGVLSVPWADIPIMARTGDFEGNRGVAFAFRHDYRTSSAVYARKDVSGVGFLG